MIIREPIELEIPQIVEVTEETNLVSKERKIILDGGNEVWAYEGYGDKFQVGDLIRYHIDTDDFRKFSPTSIAPRSRLIEIVKE